jgi:peptidoglycan/LPS O-acetylase OafA/YrhL
MIQKKRIEYIDFSKGFAILSIVIFHYLQPYTSGILSKVIMIGGGGVHLFFILSGFGLGLSSQQLSAPLFYKRRFLKVLIPYYFVILLTFAINFVYPIYREDGLYAIGGHLFLYKMFDETIMGSFGYHFWFISTIVQFYIFFPLISAWQHRESSIPKFLLVSFLISFFYWIFLSVYKLYDQRIFNSFFLQYLWEFNIGIIFAKLHTLKGKEFWRQNEIILLTTSVLSFFLMAILVSWGGGIGRTFNDPLSSLGFLCASAFLYSVSQTKLVFVKKAMIFVGKISYELYLIHSLVFLLVNAFISNVILLDLNAVYSLFLILPLSILISNLFIKFMNFFYQIPLVSRLF